MLKTNYSFRKAFGKPDDVVKRAKECGYKYAPIADVENTFGFSEWTKACEKHDMIPIYGVQLAVTESANAKKPAVDYFTFYAKDNLKALNDVIEMAYQKGRKLPRLGFVPLILYSDLSKDVFKELIVVSGRKARLNLLPDHVFAGVSPSVTKRFIRDMQANNIAPFYMLDQFYVNKEDQQAYEIYCGFNADVKTYDQHIISAAEWRNNFEYGFDKIDAAYINLDLKFSECTAKIESGDLLRPETTKTLRELCEEGAKIKNVNINDGVYKERLEMELKVISDKQFDDYFFICHDLIDWAKKHMLVGAGRGSSAGSLVCYLLDITDVDPIKYGLLFFRFLDPSRPDWPDIDMDFGDRDGAIQYLVKKYGTERIAKIGTKNNYKVTNTVNEVCKALDIPRFDNSVEAVIKEIDAMNLSANDKRWDTVLIDVLDNTATGKRLLDKYPEFAVAKQITGLASNAGTHASGVIVANDSIKKSFAINPESQTIMAVADDLESKGYIKLDVLALANLTVIKKTMDMVGLTRDDLRTIDLEDQKVFDVMNENRYQNIFQYEGAGVTKLAKQVKVDSFNDYIAISSFARPGPLSSGSAERWVNKKNGDMPVSYMHPLFEPYFKDTLGEMAYQEQIMLVAHDIAGLDWAIVSKMRKAIAKSMGAEALKEFGEPFKDGLMKAGVSEDVADKFWSDILGCGSYLFNKSHAAAYGLISYWTCYLKAYFPLEFACAALTTAENTDKQVSILRELDKEGTTYIPFDVENSTDEWRVIDKNGSKVLLAPLTAVKGIGNKTMTQIMACRARNEPLPESIQKRLNKATSVFSTLTPVKDYTIENNLRRHVIGDFVDIGTIECNGEWQEGLYISGVCDVIAERDENDEKRVQDRIARGQQGIMSGATKFVELRVRDDSGTVYAKIGKNDFSLWGEEILEKGREKKTMVVIKGTYCPTAPVLLVKGFKIVGEIE